MAGRGDALDDPFHHDVFGLGSDFVNLSWGQEADCYQPNYDLHSGFYSANPEVDTSFDFFYTGYPAAPEVGHWNTDIDSSDSSIELVEQSQILQPEFHQHDQPPPPNSYDEYHPSLITPPRTQSPRRRFVKQEESPTHRPTEPPYSRIASNPLVVPLHRNDPPPAFSLANASTRIPVPGAPPSPTSPDRRKRSSSSVASSPCSGSSAGISKPKKRMIKPQANAGKLPLTFRQQELRMLVDAEGTGVFQQLIPSAAEAISDQAELVRMYTKGVDYCTTLETDVTFPTDVKMEIACVRDLYDAIWDWSNYFEMSKTLGAANMAMWVEANSMDGESPRKTALLDLVPTRAEQQKKVLSRELSNYIVERISWRLMKYAIDAQQGIPTVDCWSGADGAWESYASFQSRLSAICDSLRNSKQLVKSLLSAGDGWYMRIANNPKGELTHKVNNMKVNRRKNERLREVTSQMKYDE